MFLSVVHEEVKGVGGPFCLSVFLSFCLSVFLSFLSFRLIIFCQVKNLLATPSDFFSFDLEKKENNFFLANLKHVKNRHRGREEEIERQKDRTKEG